MPNSLRQLEPWLYPYAEYLLSVFPPGTFTVTSVRRSRTEQLRLWNNRHRNPYPVAPPGTSKHELGRAWDMVGAPRALARAGAIWRKLGGRWWPADRIHFEA